MRRIHFLTGLYWSIRLRRAMARAAVVVILCGALGAKDKKPQPSPPPTVKSWDAKLADMWRSHALAMDMRARIEAAKTPQQKSMELGLIEMDGATKTAIEELRKDCATQGKDLGGLNEQVPAPKCVDKPKVPAK